MFENKKIHKETWVSKDGVTRNQMDFGLVDTWTDSNCLNVRSLRGVDGDTDHYFLVTTKVITRMTSQKTDKNMTTVWNTEGLKDNETIPKTLYK